MRPFAGHGTAHVAASNMLVAQPGDALDMESLTVMGQIPRRWEENSKDDQLLDSFHEKGMQKLSKLASLDVLGSGELNV